MIPPTEFPSRIGPVTLPERISTLDVIRGMALFGIIASNMRAFNGPVAAYFDHSLMWQEPANRAAQIFVDFFITGKFITLFSFLFGIGFAIQMDRAEARGLANRYLRRLAILLLIGLAHMFLLWWGDILTAYALMGMLLYLFRGASQKKILIWSAILYAWPTVLSGAFLIATAAGVPIPAPPPVKQEELQRLIQIYSSGSYAQIFQERLKDNAMSFMFIFAFGPRLLGIFLFGAWVWRQGIVRDLGAHRDLLKRCQFWGLAAGVPLNAAMVAIGEIWHPSPAEQTPIGFLFGLVGGLAMPALSLFYASTLALLNQREEWIPRLRPFGAVGRTALTNYLMQTVLCTTLYYSYGFGLYGSVGPLLGLVPTVGIYAAQAVASTWWVQRFPYGPMEWVWRRLTYGRLDPAGGVSESAREAQA